jgi:RNA polymerase sigma-70 factor (ECF subfamily)
MEPTSFHELYEAHSRHVYRYALSLCGNTADAEDITMAAFFKAWTAEPVRAQTARAYLLTIARNIFLDGRRRAWRERTLEAGHENAHSFAARQEKIVELSQALQAMRELPEAYRAPLEMWAAGGLSYEEIAAALGASVPVVKMRIHRARQMLAERLGRP